MILDLGPADEATDGLRDDEIAAKVSGQTIAAVGRFSKGFDYAPYAVTGGVSGRVKKPRKAFAVVGDLRDFGLPVYASFEHASNSSGSIHKRNTAIRCWSR